MFNLEQAIGHWRQATATASNLEQQMLDELENHLRETVHQFIESGVAEPAAFERAVAQLGTPQALATEFAKLQRPAWLPARIGKGILIILMGVALVALLAAPRHHKVTPLGVILAFHVCAVTVGYCAALLVGALGVCFVFQQAVSGFSSRRLDSIRETSGAFARFALCLTAIGVGLGMIWAKSAWGRYWGWDIKEIGALCVMIWLAGYVSAYRCGQFSPRGLLTGSVITSAIVNLAWFGPVVLSGLHSYGWFGAPWILLSTIALNVLFVLLGFAPAGCLRPHRA